MYFESKIFLRPNQETNSPTDQPDSALFPRPVQFYLACLLISEFVDPNIDAASLAHLTTFPSA